MATATEIRQDGIPLSEEETRMWADIKWAEQDQEVRAKYAGQWIAIYNRTVMAHGPDRDQVLREGAQAAQRPQEELAAWPVLSEVALLNDPPISSSEF